ncbi:major facilitator superfamily domain-containing protein [Coemansia mojavensis]|nr:major facilitator superfamily domain-containing protein [Coemansia mojavensis]
MDSTDKESTIKTTDAREATETTISPSDSAFGWVIVAGSTVLMMLALGPSNAYAVYYEEYHTNVFPEASTTVLSWIGSLQLGFMCFGCIFTGVLIERYNIQLVLFVSTVIAGSTSIVASVCNTPVALIFTQGVLYGASTSTFMVAGLSMPAQYMEKHRALATSIASSGGAAGGLWLSFATSAMISNLGWRWSLRITGFIIVVVGTACSAIMKRRVELPPRAKIIDVPAMKSFQFILLFISCVFGTGAYYCYYLFLPAYSVEVLEKPTMWSANIASILSGSSILGRLALGVCAHRFGTLNTLYATSLITAVGTFVLWLPFKSLNTLICSALFLGFFCGNVVSLAPVATANLFGVTRLPSILGLLFVAEAVGIFACTSVTAFLIDSSKDYTTPILFTGAITLVPAVAIFILRIIAYPLPRLFAKVRQLPLCS